jgi:phage terminase large subunit
MRIFVLVLITSSFVKICELDHINKVVQGSQGAGKTYSILSRWILKALQSTEPQICSVVTDTFPNLRTGAIRDFETICLKDGIQYTGTKTPFVYKVGLWTFEFFSVDVESKGLGSRRDRLFINEANRIPWKTARQLISRTRVERIFDFNPAARFWAHTQFVEVEDCSFIKLTYKDNECLPVEEVKSIEKHSPWGSNPDPNYWRVYGLGEVGFVEGQILNYKAFKELPEAEYQTAYGIDWGWQDPMTAVKVWVDHEKKRLYWKQIFYASHAKEDDLFDTIKNDYEDEVVLCDHDPRAVLAARNAGLKAMNASKKTIKGRIKTVKQYQLFIHSDSTDLLREADNWKYQVKKDVIIDYPDQSCEDHAIDAAMYGSVFICN